MESDATGVSVFMEAAGSGSEEVIDAALAVMFDELEEETVNVLPPGVPPCPCCCSCVCMLILLWECGVVKAFFSLRSEALESVRDAFP